MTNICLSVNENSDATGGEVATNDWAVSVFPFYELIRTFHFYLDLECWIVSVGEYDRWMEIRRHRGAAWLMELDYVYGKVEERKRYNQVQFKRVIAQAKTICSSYGGLSSFFLPIIRKGKVIGILQAGVFLRKFPNRKMVLELWKELTGSEEKDFSPEFFHYVRTLLGTPLVEEPVQRALKEILELYARVAGGDGDAARACRRTEELKTKVLAKYFPHYSWLEIRVKNNRFYPPVWPGAILKPWELEEIGLQRIPTTVLAVRISDTMTHQGDDLDLHLLNYRFQKDIYRFGRTLPNIALCPLEDYGMLLFTSPDPAWNEARAKAEIRDLANRIVHWAEKKLRTRILCGIDRIVRPGGSLSRTYHQAVSTLDACQQLNQSVLFYENLTGPSTVPITSDFYQLSRNLSDAFSHGTAGNLELSRRRYIREILAHSAGRPETVRIHFFYALGQIVDVLKKNSPLQKGNLDSLLKSFGKQFWETGAVPDLTVIFEEDLKQLLAFNLRRPEGDRGLRMVGARKYIDENLNLDLNLGEMARRHGFSESVFSREFKRVTGSSYAVYLRKLRIEYAMKLLTSTELPINLIIQKSGFKNPHYFFDLFKRSTRRTPQEYRDSIAPPA